MVGLNGIQSCLALKSYFFNVTFVEIWVKCLNPKLTNLCLGLDDFKMDFII